MKHIHRPLAFVCIVSLALLTACEGAQGRRLRAEALWAELEATGCDLPCWHGLHLGEAHREDVETFLADSLLVAGYECLDLSDDEEAGSSGALCYWESVADQNVRGGVFRFAIEEDEPLIQVLLYLRNSVSFEEAVAHFGEPAVVLAAQHGEPGGQCDCKERNPQDSDEEGPDFELIYPERGLVLVALGERAEQWPCLCELMWVDAISLTESAQGRTLETWWEGVYEQRLEDEIGTAFPFPGWGVAFE